NEREFLGAFLDAYQGRARIVIPRPRYIVPELDGHAVTYVRPYGGSGLRYIAHQVSLMSAIRRILQEEDVTFVVTRLAPIPFGLLQLVHGTTPYAVKTLSGDPLRTGHRMAHIVRPLRLIDRKVASMIVRRAAAVDACTPALVDRAITLGANPDAVVLVENATNTVRFKPLDREVARRSRGLDRFNPVIGFVGGRPWERGGQQIIASMPRILQLYPNAGVVIVGGGSGLEQLQ